MEDLLTGKKEKNSINESYWTTFIFNKSAQGYPTSVQVNLRPPNPITNLASLIHRSTIWIEIQLFELFFEEKLITFTYVIRNK